MEISQASLLSACPYHITSSRHKTMPINSTLPHLSACIPRRSGSLRFDLGVRETQLILPHVSKFQQCRSNRSIGYRSMDGGSRGCHDGSNGSPLRAPVSLAACLPARCRPRDSSPTLHRTGSGCRSMPPQQMQDKYTNTTTLEARGRGAVCPYRI